MDKNSFYFPSLLFKGFTLGWTGSWESTKELQVYFLWMWDWKRNKRKGSKRRKKTKKIKSNRSFKKRGEKYLYIFLRSWKQLDHVVIAEFTSARLNNSEQTFFCHRTTSNFPHGKDWIMQLEWNGLLLLISANVKLLHRKKKKKVYLKFYTVIILCSDCIFLRFFLTNTRTW